MEVVRCGCCISSPKILFFLSVSGGKDKGLPPLRTQGSPLRSDPILRYRCGLDKPLTSFTPLFNRAIIGLSPKALSFYFSFAYYLATRGMGSPEDPPFAFFAWLAHVPSELAERIRSSPARRQEGTRRAWGLRESAETATLSTCQQSKTVSFRFWR